MGLIFRKPMKLLNPDYSLSEAPAQYRVDSNRRVCIQEFHGPTNFDSFKSIHAAMTSDMRWSDDFHNLVDLSHAQLDVPSSDILRLSLLMRREENPPQGWLVYVAPGSTAHSMVRMLAYWAWTNARTKIFKTRDEAEHWLTRHCDQAPARFAETSAPSPFAEPIRRVG